MDLWGDHIFIYFSSTRRGIISAVKAGRRIRCEWRCFANYELIHKPELIIFYMIVLPNDYYLTTKHLLSPLERHFSNIFLLWFFFWGGQESVGHWLPLRSLGETFFTFPLLFPILLFCKNKQTFKQTNKTHTFYRPLRCHRPIYLYAGT